MYVFMGIIIGPAVPPIFCVLTWRKTSAWAACTAAVSGQLLGLMSWLCIAKGMYGKLDKLNTGEDYPILGGNLISMGVSVVVIVVMSLIWPQNYNWDEL